MAWWSQWCGCAHKGTLAQEMPRQESEGIPDPTPSRGSQQACWSPAHNSEAAGPTGQAEVSRPPEGLVRKEGSTAQLPQADCFPWSHEGSGGNAAPAPLRPQGKGRQNRLSTLKQGLHTTQHKPVALPSQLLEPICPAFVSPTSIWGLGARASIGHRPR